MPEGPCRAELAADSSSRLPCIASKPALDSLFIEDAYGKPPPPPAPLEAPTWPTAGLELGQAIGP
eukprot:8375931-Pyramimonas_sp.AAC.1